MSKTTTVNKKGIAISGFWSIMDQGIFAITNFGLNVLLVHRMSITAYGEFSTLYALTLLLSTLHAAYLISPMMVLGARKFSNNPSPYLKFVLKWNFIFNFFSTTIIIFIVLIASRFYTNLDPWYVMALCTPFILSLWLARQACYFHKKSQWATYTGLLYLVLVFTSLTLYSHQLSITTSQAFVILCLPSAICGIILWSKLLKIKGSDSDKPEEKEVVNFHTKFGKAEIIAAAAKYFIGYLPQLALPIMIDISSAGQYRAIIYLAMPFVMAITALQRVLVVHLASIAEWSIAKKTARSMLIVATTISLFVSPLLNVFGKPVIEFIYQDKIQVESITLISITIMIVCAIYSSIGSSIIASRNLPIFISYSNLIALVSTILLFYPLVSHFGITGALLCNAISNFVIVLALFSFIYKYNKHADLD